MIKIGDFARLSQVSIVTLRHYDEIGLLTPVAVDTATGYRYYAVAQLTRLNRILALKDLGFSLEQIDQLLEGLTAEHLRTGSRARWKARSLRRANGWPALARGCGRLKGRRR